MSMYGDYSVFDSSTDKPYQHFGGATFEFLKEDQAKGVAENVNKVLYMEDKPQTAYVKHTPYQEQES